MNMGFKNLQNIANSTIGLIILAAVSGGSVFPIIKVAESYSIPVFSYIMWESIFIVIALFLIGFFTKNIMMMRGAEFRYYLFCALTNIIIPQFLFFLIAPNLPASVMGLIIILTPLFVYLGLLVLGISNHSLHKLMGIIFGFIGASILFVPNLLDVHSLFQWQWALFGLLLPLNYALNRIYASKLKPEDSNNFRLAIGLFSFVAVIACISMIVSGDYFVPFQSQNDGAYIILIHSFVMIVFYLTFFKLADRGALENSLASYFVPFVTLAWGMVLFGEQITILYWVSLFLIFIGLVFINKKEK